MDRLRDLKLFVAVYEERSFTAAAEREHFTQSGVSHHIRQLEERRGARLFLRGTGRSVHPTPAGDAYYRACLDILRAFEKANTSLEAFSGGLEGEVTVGMVPTVTRSFLAPALALFVEKHPNVVIRAVEANSGQLISEVRSRQLDFAIGFKVTGQVGYRSTAFARTPCLLVSRKRSEFKHMVPVRIASLKSPRFASPPHPNAVREAIERHLQANNVAVARWLEFGSMSATLDFVARTDWLAIVPGMVLTPNIEVHALTVSPIRPPLSMELVLIEPVVGRRSKAAQVFLDLLGEVIESRSSQYVQSRWTSGRNAGGL